MIAAITLLQQQTEIYERKCNHRATEWHAHNYWKGNFAQINRDVAAIDWDMKLAGKNTEDAWTTFRQLMRNSILENVPTKKANKKLKKNPWMTRSTRRKLHRRDKAWKK